MLTFLPKHGYQSSYEHCFSNYNVYRRDCNVNTSSLSKRMSPYCL